MAAYILDEGVSIERWKQGRPCAVVPETPRPVPLDPDELELLKQCDGKTEVESSALSDRLEMMRIIRRCREDAASGQPFSIIDHPNFFVESIDWTITDRCNYNCRHCFHAADNTTQRDEFSPEEAMRFLDEVRECGIRNISLTGGEPTLYPHFREIVEGMSERGLRLSTLITNGSLLTPELLLLLKEHHPHVLIRLSFDGIGWHDWMRQHEGSENKTLEIIRLCRSEGLRVHVNCNVHRRNADVMFDTAKMLEDMGAGRIRIIRTSESPRWLLNKGDDTLTPEEYYDFSIRIAEQYRDSGMQVPVVIWQSLLMNGKERIFKILPVKGHAGCFTGKELLCSSLMKKPSVQANGEVVPCAPLGGYFGFHDIHVGNVRESSLQELLTEGPFVDIITATAGEKLKNNEKCAACPHVKECRGGCTALSYASGGTLYSSDEYKCIFFINGYPEKYRQAFEGWREI